MMENTNDGHPHEEQQNDDDDFSEVTEKMIE